MSMKTVNTSNYLFIIFQITSSESPSFISNYFGSLFTHIQEINYMSIHLYIWQSIVDSQNYQNL